MPHIFRFHKGITNSIIDWKPSDRITTASVKEVRDKLITVGSPAGTSIPTPLARMFLFKTAFEIVAAQVRDNTLSGQSIYAGLVSETLDLLELLYKHGSDSSKFRYKKWSFDSNEGAPHFFGSVSNGHKLLAKSFEQAADQKPFNKRIEITLIYYKEQEKEVLIGGTSPFTFVFTSPNFKRKLRERRFKPVSGLVSNDTLFDTDYLQLHERDAAFIKYIEILKPTENIENTFAGFLEYVEYSRIRNEDKFNGRLNTLEDIRNGETALMVSGIPLRQITTAGQQSTINECSDFKMYLPDNSPYKKSGRPLVPLFLTDRMELAGQYSSPSSLWSAQTRVLEIEYPSSSLEKILQRELPGLKIAYPFLSSFDFFEAELIRLSGYALNDARFVTLANDQDYLFPIKPLFFHFFPIEDLDKYLRVESTRDQVTFTLSVPVFGPFRSQRNVVCIKTYNLRNAIPYDGILGVYPFTQADAPELNHINDYTVASFEKTNTGMELQKMLFYKKNGINTVPSTPTVRSEYSVINTKSSYYPIPESFDFIQLSFRANSVTTAGIVIPKFKKITTGHESFVYAIDFGTSNTHVEYATVTADGQGKQVNKSKRFEIGADDMQMFLLNKPDKNGNYELSLGNIIDTARQITIREFVPFTIGEKSTSDVKFPFRTATCESKAFTASSANDRLFAHANVGFSIDKDVNNNQVNYKTDLKWLLQQASTDQLNRDRVSIFARELLLLIRTKALLDGADLNKLQVILSFPISMGENLQREITALFDTERTRIFGEHSMDFAPPVTESIAPYYQLKAEDNKIQNDPFCNIDIGGGTTDIVLTNPGSTASNSLQCICSSFKFAGRQLWSSGSNPYMFAANGFLSYYKDFIKRTDATLYNKLDQVFNNDKVKTEDVIGLLFSKPGYKFKDIFVDNPELKVVLLIHYAAILYYTARISVLRNAELPRTVSFSGKGSEYLSSLLPNSADLQGLTKYLLEVFSGKKARTDFQLKRSGNDPKIITAQGALHFAVEGVKDQVVDEWNLDSGAGNTAQNSTDKTLIKEEATYLGFNNLSFEKEGLRYADLANQPELYQDIMQGQINFFNLLFNDEGFKRLVNKKLEIKDFFSYKQFFIKNESEVFDQGILRDSFKATVANYPPSELIADSPFFFPLNYALTEFSTYVANQNKTA